MPVLNEIQLFFIDAQRNTKHVLSRNSRGTNAVIASWWSWFGTTSECQSHNLKAEELGTLDTCGTCSTMALSTIGAAAIFIVLDAAWPLSGVIIWLFRPLSEDRTSRRGFRIALFDFDASRDLDIASVTKSDEIHE